MRVYKKKNTAIRTTCVRYLSQSRFVLSPPRFQRIDFRVEVLKPSAQRFYTRIWRVFKNGEGTQTNLNYLCDGQFYA